LRVPVLRGLFSFGALSAVDLMICVVAAVISVAWFELLKLYKKGFV
jgi:hypothetical protein